MVATKFLYVIIIVFVVFSIYFLFTIALNQESEAFVDKSLESFVNASYCVLGKFENKCSELGGDICKQNPNCMLCERDLDSSVVSRCENNICGCSFGWNLVSGNIIFSLDKESYQSDDTIGVFGKIVLLEDEAESPEIRLSFTDRFQNKIPYIPGSTVIGSADDEGNYEWEYQVPEDIEDGIYLLKLEYGDGVYFLDLRIYGTPDKVIETPEITPPDVEIPGDEEPEVPEPVVPEPGVPDEDAVTLNVLMLQHGDSMTNEELDELKDLAEEAMIDVTEGDIKLNIIRGGNIPLPEEDSKHDYSSVEEKYPWLGDDGAKRVWYFISGGGNQKLSRDTILYEDVRNAAIEAGFDPEKYDFPIVITEAQASFGGVHFRDSISGASLIAVTQPVEFNFESETFHATQVNTKYMMTDLIIHEIGHYLSLGHHCQKTRCAECKSGTSIMTYCPTSRSPGFTDTYYREYSSCSLSIIRDDVIPEIRQGNYKTTQTVVCEDKK